MIKTHKNYIETNLLSTLLPKTEVSKDIIKFANKTSSNIKIIFEADNCEDLDKLKENFLSQIDLNYFEFNKPDTKKLLDIYIKNPENFLSYGSKKLLMEKKYNEIYKKSISRLYNPANIELTEFDKDPYLLVDDFILSFNKLENKIEYYNNKCYDIEVLKIKNGDGLSPELSNKKIRELLKLEKKLSGKNSNIYITGVPIHSYCTSKKSVISINIICFLSVFIISFLTYKYFRNLKLLILIALSIISGMLFGYLVTKFWFSDFQIITFLFSTTLIGIGVDYSYHYFYSDKADKNFIKNLTFSLFTTIIPFLLLYCTKIELLEQISIFTIFGLIGIYFTVLFIYPCFNFTFVKKEVKLNTKIYKYLFIVFLILGIFGIFRFNFNDNLATLYNPDKKLVKNEMLYEKVSNEKKDIQIIKIKGKNIDEIIKNEEKITAKLDNKNIEYLCLSKFISSKELQYQNFILVKDLYKNNLNNYSDILSNEQINILKNKNFTPVLFNMDDFPYLKNFLIDKNTSFIIVYSKENLNIPNIEIINLKKDIEQKIKEYREKVLILFPFVIFSLFIFLKFIYGFKKGFKIILPSFIGIILSICLTSLIFGEVNFFNLITMFLILGFTLDYSIFRCDMENNTESAIFISSVTTLFSFFLLIFCGFKLLSSMAHVLFFGILISYITGYFVFRKHDKITYK